MTTTPRRTSAAPHPQPHLPTRNCAWGGGERAARVATSRFTSPSAGALIRGMPLPRALIIASAAAALIATAVPACAQTVSGRATVIDGETLEIRGQRVRLFGLEQAFDDHVCARTDDERWKCGPRALNALDEFLEEAVVSCVMRERDNDTGASPQSTPNLSTARTRRQGGACSGRRAMQLLLKPDE